MLQACIHLTFQWLSVGHETWTCLGTEFRQVRRSLELTSRLVMLLKASLQLVTTDSATGGSLQLVFSLAECQGWLAPTSWHGPGAITKASGSGERDGPALARAETQMMDWVNNGRWLIRSGDPPAGCPALRVDGNLGFDYALSANTFSFSDRARTRTSASCLQEYSTLITLRSCGPLF